MNVSVSPSPSPYARHVVVVGGGIAGLAAAWFLTVSEPRPRVTVLEESARFGGKLYADEIAGVPVDLGAESMLVRRPEAVDLVHAVGLGDALEPPATTAPRLWTRGTLRPLPIGQVMGVPGDPRMLAASGVLSLQGLARVPLDYVLPRTPLGDDVAVGAYVAARLGPEVVDRLVEPLLGGVYAGDSYQLSLKATVPQLYAAARRERSLIAAVRGMRRGSPAPHPQGGARALGLERGEDRQAASPVFAASPASPVFAGVSGGVGRLPIAVAEACRARGADLLTRTTVREVRRFGSGWQLLLQRADGESTLDADAVVLAVPAPAAAQLLRAEAPQAAAELAAVEYANMALVTMAFRGRDVTGVPSSSGFLVPPVDGRTIKAATFSTHKWGWTARADPETFVLRTSVGRYGDPTDPSWDDTDLVRLSRTDLADAVGLTAAPIAARVTRWEEGLPQYPVGHLERVARVRATVGKLPGLAVCGAAYEGVGIPACVASARRAVEGLLMEEGASSGPGRVR